METLEKILLADTWIDNEHDLADVKGAVAKWLKQFGLNQNFREYEGRLSLLKELLEELEVKR